MPISITIHESGKYMVAKFRGRVSDSELRPAYESFYAGHDIPINFPELCDLSTADMNHVTQPGLATFAAWVRDLFERRGETARKTAYFLPGLFGRAPVIIYEVLMQDSPEITRTFPNLDDAVRWLLDPSPESAVRVPTRI
jgi:hypothetical protein